MSPDTLTTLLADPAQASAIPRAKLPAIIGQLEQLKAALWTSLAAPVAPEKPGGPSDDQCHHDELLTVQRLGEALDGVLESWRLAANESRRRSTAEDVLTRKPPSDK